MRSLKWLWFLVPLVGVAELAAHNFYRESAPAPEQWREAADYVRAQAQGGDLVVTAPYWAEPNLRAQLGDELMTLKDVARADDSTYRRAIEVSVTGGESELKAGGHGSTWRHWFQQAPNPPGWTLQSEERHGRFTIRILENPNHQATTFDFIDALGPEAASVWLKRKRKTQACEWTKAGKVSNGALHGHPTFPRKRFACTKGDHFVGVTVIEDQNYRPRRCIWAKPHRNKSLVIRFEDVPVGAAIKGHAGLPWFLERESKGRPVELSVRIENKVLGQMRHQDGEGWKPFAFDTSQFEGQSLGVEFIVKSKSSHRREFCFHADVRETL